MLTNLEAIERMQDKADCAAKELVYKWMRVAEIQSGEVL